MNSLGERQIRFNTTSRDQWEAFAEHRQHLTALLAGTGNAAGSRLCVLGAGNANDLDLPILLQAYREVHLVDLDDQALRQGAARQQVAEHPGLHRHGGVDLTGTLGLVSGWSPLSGVTAADLDAMRTWPGSRVAQVLPGGFDRVASLCVLSQILETARHALGADHSRLNAVEHALRAGHLRLMARLAAPDGQAVVASEVVSSDTVPHLSQMSPDELAQLMPRLLREANHFRGVHPKLMRDAVMEDPGLRTQVVGIKECPPWRWQLHNRVYLITALVLDLKPATSTAIGGRFWS